MNTRIGIILAAGESSRLPGKAMLPVGVCGRPAICEVIASLEPHVGKIIIALRDDSAIPDIVNAYADRAVLEHCEIAYHTQYTSVGMPWACRQVVEHIKDTNPVPDQCIVAFCDGMFIGGFPAMPSADDNMAFITATLPTVQTQHLDRWGFESWLERDDPNVNDTMPCFTGPMILRTVSMFQASPGMSTVQFLNKISARSVFHMRKWFDIGTPETYRAYQKYINE